MKRFMLAALLALTAVSGTVVLSDPAAAINEVARTACAPSGPTNDPAAGSSPPSVLATPLT